MAFRRQSLTRAFKNNQQLQRFVLINVTPTGKVLGTGSFGSVEEVLYTNVACAGKKLHEALIEAGQEGVSEMVHKYLQECQLMASLRHPNITQFLGVCFFPGTWLPILVMELLETSLDSLLQHIPNLPLSLKRDVAAGLLYLHEKNPVVIHRDLTANNVLLTSSLVAKITDMGNSRIVDMRPGQVARTLSKVPGTFVYMPPEALDDRHRYGTSLDIFSFGHLALFTITQTFPGDLLPSTFPNPENLQEVQGRTELERRGQYMELLEAHIGHFHPGVVLLVKQCLHNVPARRPNAGDLLTRLRGMRVEVEGEYGGGPANIDVITRVRVAKKMKEMNTRIEELTRQLELQTAELQQKAQESESWRMEAERARNDAEGVRRENEDMQRVVEKMKKELKVKTKLIEEVVKRGTPSKEMEVAVRIEQLEKVHTPPLEFSWRQGPDMPSKICGRLQSVVVGGTVYVGSTSVMAYDISEGKWRGLPPFKTHYFGMTKIQDRVVLVGGNEHGSGVSRTIGVWSEREWTHPYPDMLNARSHCSAFTYDKWLVVAGGIYKELRAMSAVDILDTGNKQWQFGYSMPTAWHSMRTAVIGDVCYVLGGSTGRDGRSLLSTHITDKVYCVHLPGLISSTFSRDRQIWEEVSGLGGLTDATPLCVNGRLLVVGGMKKNEAVSTILLYKPDTGKWVKAGDLPTPRYDSTCVMSTEREMLVAGGYNGVYLNTVDIAEISAM